MLRSLNCLDFKKRIVGKYGFEQQRWFFQQVTFESSLLPRSFDLKGPDVNVVSMFPVNLQFFELRLHPSAISQSLSLHPMRYQETPEHSFGKFRV